MKIRIKTSEQLAKLLKALAGEITSAHIYHRLFCDLVDSIPTYKREFQQSNTFWHLTLDSLKEVRLSRLCRVFDQKSRSLNLVNLLDTIKANPHLFQEEPFRKRLRDSAFVDSLARDNRVPCDEELNRDIEYASTKNPLVKKLIVWRNNIVAHRSVALSLGETRHLDQRPISKAEIEELLASSLAIFNKYSSLYSAETWSRQIIGHDDYKSLLSFVRRGLQKRDEEIEAKRRERHARNACKSVS
jgi:hypothetical protein